MRPWGHLGQETPFRDVSGFDLNGCHVEIDRSAAGFSLNLGDPKKTETGWEWLVGGYNPSEKILVKMGIFPGRDENKNVWTTTY